MRRLIITAALTLGLAPPAMASAVTVPTERWGPQVRPHLIDYTGDGSALLGGFTRHHRLHKSSPLADFGRLRWTTYNARQGRAWGADWIDNFIPDGAAGTFHPIKVDVHVYRPRRGVFTRMTVTEHGHRYTFHAHGDLWF